MRQTDEITKVTTIRFSIRRITFDPNFPVGVDFFLPDRNRSFQFSDQPLACGERRLSMRCRDRDHDTCLADLEFSNPMNDPDIRDLKSNAWPARSTFAFPSDAIGSYAS